jgi:hypothetical protein
MIRRLLLLALVAYCATLHAEEKPWEREYAGYTWHLTSRPLAIPEWHAVSVDELPKYCLRGWMGASACAVIDAKKGICHIYSGQSEADTPEWLRWHEYLHCAGWDHGPAPFAAMLH